MNQPQMEHWNVDGFKNLWNYGEFGLLSIGHFADASCILRESGFVVFTSWSIFQIYTESASINKKICELQHHLERALLPHIWAAFVFARSECEHWHLVGSCFILNWSTAVDMVASCTWTDARMICNVDIFARNVQRWCWDTCFTPMNVTNCLAYACTRIQPNHQLWRHIIMLKSHTIYSVAITWGMTIGFFTLLRVGGDLGGRIKRLIPRD